MKKTFFIFLVLFLYSNANGEYSIIKNIIDNGTESNCKISNIDDGDTFDISCRNENTEKYFPNVRLLGINAPDLSGSGSNKYEHCYYNEAKKAMNSIRKRNINVEFYGSDLCMDQYKGCRNLVRLIDHETGIDINEFLTSKGYTFSWTNFSMIPRDLKIKLIKAERRAKEGNLGLWSKCEITYDHSAKTNTSIPSKMTR